MHRNIILKIIGSGSRSKAGFKSTVPSLEKVYNGIKFGSFVKKYSTNVQQMNGKLTAGACSNNLCKRGGKPDVNNSL